MKRFLHIFLLSVAAFCLFSTSKVSAFVYEQDGSAALVPQITPDNTVGVYPDSLGNQFLYYSYVSPKKVQKITASGTVAWEVTLPAVSMSNPNFVPDGLGGFYVTYSTGASRVGVPGTVQNLHVHHVNSSGATVADNVQVLSSGFGQKPELAFADSAGGLSVIYSESQFGDADLRSVSYKLMHVNSTGSLTSATTTRTLTPTESRWCTNRGASTEIPFDVYNGGAVMWSKCWDWCQSEFATTSGTCQYNADGPRNCWVNEFPAGGVGNCVWEDFSPGNPPYSGYDGITQLNEPTSSITIPFIPSEDNSYSVLRIAAKRVVSDGVLVLYYIVETHATVPATATSKYYVQKFNNDGTPLLSGFGTDVTSYGTNLLGKFVFMENGWMLPTAVDTNSDSHNDTVRVQKYALDGTPEFSGDGVDAYSHVESGTDIYVTAQQHGAGLSMVIEAYNASVPESGDVNKIIMQAIDAQGNLLLGENGTQLASYQDPHVPLATWDVSNDGSGGTVVSVNYEVTGTAETGYRLFWLDASNRIHYVQSNGLAIGTIINGGFTCNAGADGLGTCIVASYTGEQHQVFALKPAYQLATSGGLDIISSNGNSIINTSDFGIGESFSGYSDLLTAKDADGDLVFQVSATISQDRDWSTVTASSDSAAHKSFAHGVTSAPGAATTYELFVPRGQTDNVVYVCPDVSQLVDVSESCVGSTMMTNNQTLGVSFAGGSSNVTAQMVTVGADAYWKLSGMKGSGAISGFNDSNPTVTPTPTITPSISATTSPTPADTVAIVTLPPVTTGINEVEETGGIVCPVFTKFSVNPSVVEPGQEVTISWKATNANSVTWYGVEYQMETEGTRSFVPEKSTTPKFIADNGMCVAKQEQEISVVSTLPWKNSAAVGVGALAVEAAIVQVSTLYAAAAALPPAGNSLQGNLWLALAGFLDRRRKKKWGIVYDAVTKKPISRAVVRLIEKNTGNVLDISVSDAKGIIRLAAASGTYLLQAVHPGYTFPSNLIKLPVDGGYGHIYTGDELTINDLQPFVAISIPMDPVELTPFMRRKVQALTYIENAGNYGGLALLAVGFMYSLYVMILFPIMLNKLILGVYFILLFSKLALLVIKPKLSGKVTTPEGKPVPGLELGLFDAEFKNLVYRTFTDSRGQYSFFVANGIYVMRILDQRYALLRGTKKVEELVLVPKEKSEAVRYIADDLTVVEGPIQAEQVA